MNAIRLNVIRVRQEKVPMALLAKRETQTAIKGERWIATQATFNDNILICRFTEKDKELRDVSCEKVVPASEDVFLTLNDGSVKVSGNDIYAAVWNLTLEQEFNLRYGLDGDTLCWLAEMCKSFGIIEIHHLKGEEEIRKFHELESEKYKPIEETWDSVWATREDVVVPTMAKPPVTPKKKHSKEEPDCGERKMIRMCFKKPQNEEDEGVLKKAHLYYEAKKSYRVKGKSKRPPVIPELIVARCCMENISEEKICEETMIGITQIVQFVISVFRTGDKSVCKCCGKPINLINKISATTYPRNSSISAAVKLFEERRCFACTSYEDYLEARRQVYIRHLADFGIPEEDFEETIITMEGDAPECMKNLKM